MDDNSRAGYGMVDYWLGQCYHYKGGPEILDLFKKRLAADQSLKKQAQQKLTEVQSANRKAQIAGGSRCHISQKYAEILQSVLS